MVGNSLVAVGLSFDLLIVVLLCFAGLGLGILIRGLRGRSDWASPMCAACNYSLQGLDRETLHNCPECGADLRRQRAVYFGRYGRSKKLVAVGIGVILIPLMVFGARIAGGAMGIRLSKFRSNTSVINELARNASDDATWNELMERYFDGRLREEDIAKAIDHLISSLQARSGTHAAPLGSAQNFVEVLAAEQRMSDGQFRALCEAFYARAIDASMPARGRRGGEVLFTIRGMHFEIAGLKQVYALRSVTLDDELLPVRPMQRGHSTRINIADLSAVNPWGFDGQFTIDAAPGQHEIAFLLDIGAIQDSQNRFGPFAPPGQANDWPETVFTKSMTIRMPFTVLGKDESAIALVLPMQHRQSIESGLNVTALRFGIENGMMMAKLIINPSPQTPVPLSFRVFIKTGKSEEDIGSFTARDGGVSMSGFIKQMNQFSDEVTTVDVAFRPDPQAVEANADWTEIWGQEIIVRDVPVIRAATQKEMNRQAVRACLHVTGVRLGAKHGERITGPGINMLPAPSPVSLRFRIFIQSGTFEHEIGTAFDVNGMLTKVIPGTPVDGFPADVDSANVIFRPYLDGIAENRRGEFWNEEVVIPNVPVIRDSNTATKNP